MNGLSLKAVLEIFNAPITEEQAWALCHQCINKLIHDLRDNAESHAHQKTCDAGSGAVLTTSTIVIGVDGTILALAEDGKERKCREVEVIRSLGVVLFQALDYGLGETEEQLLSIQLGQLIEQMTAGDESACEEHDGTDEGIGEETGFDRDELSTNNETSPQKLTLSEIVKRCKTRSESGEDAAAHYKAVCRALVAEAVDLKTFLEKIHCEAELLKSSSHDVGSLHELETLHRTDWARLWIQIMRELRQGVKLKKVPFIQEKNSIEYELTPYEILMDDLRSRRYKLNKVSEEDKIMSVQVKKDVHAIILEFIRSRPPLHPVSQRKLSSPPTVLLDPREDLMKDIRNKRSLKPTPGQRYRESSITRLDDKDEKQTSTRKVIKPDVKLILSDSFEDEDDSLKLVTEERNRIFALPFDDFTPLSPKSPPKQHLPWQRAASDDSCDDVGVDGMLGEPVTSDEKQLTGSFWSQVDKFMAPDFTNIISAQTSLECLSLTVEEVMHIRNVLTKAELECFTAEPDLYRLLASRKMCFACKKTKFGPFGLWSTTCKFCSRSVCSKCIGKMRIPTEHFEHIPVYTLSPGSPSSTSRQLPAVTGSAPSSPNCTFNSSSVVERASPVETTADNTITESSSGFAAQILATFDLSQHAQRGHLQRSKTTVQESADSSASSSGNSSIRCAGLVMNVCRDCRTMITNIVRSSRQMLLNHSTAMAAARAAAVERVFSGSPVRHRAKDFRLDLKPVYRL